MRCVKYMYGEFAKKGLLLLVGLALFAVPLSHKFYLFASRQDLRRGGSAQMVKHPKGFGTALRDFEHYRLLSLDKRYDFKQTFGALFPFLIPLAVPFCSKTNRSITTDPTFIRSVCSSLLRGPPFLSFA
jgi:hypothetical protein